MRYHTTVTSGLQCIARLARASPQVAVIRAPLAKALQVAERQADRYPTIGADHGTRTALRRVGMPAVQLVILPPDRDMITLVLLSNVAPDDREQWQLALDPDWPLHWRNYQLASGPTGAITWRLTEAIREHYRKRINRLITGRGGPPGPGERPYQYPPETARTQVLLLAQHLQRYPGLGGVRRDVYALAQHSTRVWQGTHPDQPYPHWPTMPYLPYRRPQTAPLSDLKELPNE